MLQRAYPNSTVEYLILEETGTKKLEALTFQGREHGQLVIFSRIRDCSEEICQTVAVDDYRYEIASGVRDTKSWYKVVATFRVLGQTDLQEASVFRKLFVSLRTVTLIPSQVVVYGSLFPIVCYVLAHLIDGRFAQEILATEYISTQGAVYNFNFERYLRINAIAMRSVWKVAFLCHILVIIHTRRSWTPNRGVLGVPEFFLSLIIVPTIFAQFRVLSGRDTRILEMEEVIDFPRQIELQSSIFFSKHNFIGSLLVGGSSIDIKCMLCGFVLLCAVHVVVNSVHVLFPRWQPFQMVMMSRTKTPCTAGTLWQPNGLVVSWDGTIFVNPARRRLTSFTVRSLTSHVSLMMHGMVARRLTKMPPQSQSALKRFASGTFKFRGASKVAEINRLDAMIYIMNLAIMSDPVTLFQLRVISRQQVGVYESRHTRRRFLLPYPLHEMGGNFSIDWNDLRLVIVMNTRELQWWVLLQCG
ncbi:hypothetical protein Poli38472_011403 [Pythium oligandrum]|uniref:Uncharacterized protein n=1 Tax=Pythium oligandrum TaxID=41045 RepID=A0A8K1CLH1_PYTOL|nr:hypothetical protein Poli38472_011403 [Pythium oligandrum]|eukprot:TMW64523.1 hypothetical protein Poli38472_011403 [Pythium oligandrum]